MMVTHEAMDIALLTMGELKLAIPQHEIMAVDVVADALPNDSGYPMIAAILNRQDGVWPVLSLTEKLQLENSLSTDCRFFACIKCDGLFYALACDAMELLELDVSVSQRELPDIMKNAITPVDNIMQLAGDLVLQTNALSINRYVNSLGVLDVEKD